MLTYIQFRNHKNKTVYLLNKVIWIATCLNLFCNISMTHQAFPWCTLLLLSTLLKAIVCLGPCPLSSFLVICQHSTATCFCFENPCLFWWHEQLCILWCDFWPWQVRTVDAQKLSTYWLTSNQKYVVFFLIQNIFQKNHRGKLVSVKILINYVTYVALSKKPDIQCIWSSKSLNRVTTSLS